MKKSLTLILATLLLCSCSNNPSKQTSEILSESTSCSEVINNSSNPEISVSESQSSTVVEKEFSNARMDDVTVTYDGKPHTITPTGIPEGTEVTYGSASSFTDAGVHTVSVLLRKDGYQNKFLSATLTINVASMSDVTFESETVMYDGKPHSISVKNAPSGSSITYKRENGSGTNQFTEKGKYEITATVTNKNYNSVTLKATLNIIGYDDLYGVDTSKQAYQFSNDLVWNEVFPEMLKGNYTLLIYSGIRVNDTDDYSLKEGEAYTKIVCDGQECYHEYYSKIYNGYEYDLYMIHGDDVIDYYVDFTVSSDVSYTKMPKEAMGETVLKYYPARAFNGLQEVNGKVAPGVDLDDYYSSVGTYEIKDNHLIIKLEHGVSGDGLSYEIYDFYNVGNSKLDLPRSLLPSDEKIKDLGIVSGFYIGGVQYRYALVSTWNSPTEYMAHTYMYHWQQLIVEPGTHLVRAAIYDRPVERVVYSFYSEVNIYNFNMSGYELNLCFDENGDYQGEYAKFGSVTDRTSGFVNHGGVVHYYNEWAH